MKGLLGGKVYWYFSSVLCLSKNIKTQKTWVREEQHRSCLEFIFCKSKVTDHKERTIWKENASKLVTEEGKVQHISKPVILIVFTQSLYIKKPTGFERNSHNVKLLKNKMSVSEKMSIIQDGVCVHGLALLVKCTAGPMQITQVSTGILRRYHSLQLIA